MSHQITPPNRLAPSLSPETYHEDALRIWIDLMKTSDQLVMAGLEQEVGHENVRCAFRRWYADQAARHGRHLAKLVKRLH